MWKTNNNRKIQKIRNTIQQTHCYYFHRHHFIIIVVIIYFRPSFIKINLCKISLSISVVTCTALPVWNHIEWVNVTRGQLYSSTVQCRCTSGYTSQQILLDIASASGNKHSMNVSVSNLLPFQYRLGGHHSLTSIIITR